MSVNTLLKIALAAATVAFLAIVGWNLRDTTVAEATWRLNFPSRLTGAEATPTNFGGKILVLNFWATWCPRCITETPSLSEFERKFRDKGVVVLAVSVDKSAQKYKRFLGRFNVAFDTYRDPEATISSEYRNFPVSGNLHHQGRPDPTEVHLRTELDERRHRPVHSKPVIGEWPLRFAGVSLRLTSSQCLP